MSAKPNKFTRISEPRVDRAVDAIRLVGNGVTHDPSPEQAVEAISKLEEAVSKVRVRYGLEAEVGPTGPAQSASPALLKQRSEWDRHNIPRNVSAIPKNLLGSYLIQMADRMADIVEASASPGEEGKNE